MGKSAMSCFNIITCSRDSAGYDDFEMLESRASSDRQKWSFWKRSARNHFLSNSVTSAPLPVISNDKGSQEAGHNTFYPPEDSFSFEKISSPKRMDKIPCFSLDTVHSKAGGPSCTTQERVKTDPDVQESATIVIQTAIRRYLAHMEMKKVKSVIKLQAAVRGHFVRRQAAGTLRCVQAIIKMQALIWTRFGHQSAENLANQRKCDVMHETDCERLKSLEKESSGTKHRQTYSATEKLLTNGFACQLLESTPKTKPIHIDCDPSRSDSSAWKWLERWMALASLDIGQQQELNLNCTYQDLGKNTRLDVSELANEVPAAVGPVSQDSQMAMPDHNAQSIVNPANDFEFQAPVAIMDECLCPPIKVHQGCHQPKNDLLNVAQEYHTKDEATRESSSLSSSGTVFDSQPPDTVLDKPEPEKEKSNCPDSRLECESPEAEGKKSALGINKVFNPAFISAESKFKDLCSAGSLKSVGTSNKVVSVGSRPEISPLGYFTKSNGSFWEDSAAHAPGGQISISECGTISSTHDSPGRSEGEGGEIVLEIGDFGSVDFDVDDGTDHVFKILNLEPNNLPAPETDDSLKMEQQPSLEQHLSEPILSYLQAQQEKVIHQEACCSSPEGSPRRSHITTLESEETPSSQIFLNTKKSNNENNMHERKQRYQVVGKKSLSNLNNDSGGRSSTERLSKSSKNAEKRSSFGMPKLESEPRVSISNSLPNYMQTTESARAKVHASNSPKPSPEVQDTDSNTKKRNSLSLGNGKQVSSPRMQQSSSQMQQNTKGSGLHSPRNPAGLPCGARGSIDLND